MTLRDRIRLIFSTLSLFALVFWIIFVVKTLLNESALEYMIIAVVLAGLYLLTRRRI